MVRLSSMWRSLFCGTLFAVSACASDPIAPGSTTQTAATEAASSRGGNNADSKARDSRARNGDSFRLNSAAATLTVRGETVSIPAALVPRLEKLLDVHAKGQAKSARFDADRNHRKYRAELEARGRQVRARAATAQNSSPRLLGGSQRLTSEPLAARSAPGVVAGPTNVFAELQGEQAAICRDLSETMYDKQQELNRLNYEIGQLLWAIVRAQNSAEPWNPNWVAGFATLMSQLTLLEMEQWQLEIELNVIAAMWNLNDCWDWQNTPPPPVGGGGGDDDSGNNGNGCHEEYAYLEESYDGGVTWVVVWEGYVTVC